MSRLTGAKAVIATLQAHGITTIFGIPGVHTLPIYDALRDTPEIRHVLARHEQGAGFMAEGYARVTGQPGVVCTITGPGVTNVATPVASAYTDSVPLLVISTSLSRASQGRPRGELHDLKSQFGMMESLAGWTRSVAFVEEIPSAIHDAIYALRAGRPRAAYLQIPLDLLTIEADIPVPEPAEVVPLQPTKKAIADTAALLRQARRPFIIAGAGVTAAGANQSLAHLAELLHAPVLLNAKSHDVLPNDHPLVITTMPFRLPPAINELARSSDGVLVVGSKLSAVRTGGGRLPLPSALAQIDIDPAEIGRNYPVAVSVVADARLALNALFDELSVNPGTWLDQTDEIAAAREAVKQHTHRTYGESVAMLDAIRAALPRESIIISDMTVLGYASSGYLPVYEPRTYINPSEFCTIGCGLPIALGAKVAAPDRPVLALCGDGGFLLNVGELASAVQEKIDIIIVIFNDSTYTAVKNSQTANFQGRYIATDLVAPDYVALARAFGATGVLAQSAGELRDAIEAALQRAGTTLIEVPLPPVRK